MTRAEKQRILTSVIRDVRIQIDDLLRLDEFRRGVYIEEIVDELLKDPILSYHYEGLKTIGLSLRRVLHDLVSKTLRAKKKDCHREWLHTIEISGDACEWFHRSYASAQEMGNWGRWRLEHANRDAKEARYWIRQEKNILSINEHWK